MIVPVHPEKVTVKRFDVPADADGLRVKVARVQVPVAFRLKVVLA